MAEAYVVVLILSILALAALLLWCFAEVKGFCGQPPMEPAVALDTPNPLTVTLTKQTLESPLHHNESKRSETAVENDSQLPHHVQAASAVDRRAGPKAFQRRMSRSPRTLQRAAEPFSAAGTSSPLAPTAEHSSPQTTSRTGSPVVASRSSSASRSPGRSPRSLGASPGRSPGRSPRVASRFSALKSTTVPAAPPPAPGPWSLVQDPKTGQDYYFNSKLGTTSWTRPHDAQYLPLPRAMWSAQVDESSGAVFYFDPRTGETTWELPPGAVLAVPPKGKSEVSAPSPAARPL